MSQAATEVLNNSDLAKLIYTYDSTYKEIFLNVIQEFEDITGDIIYEYCYGDCCDLYCRNYAGESLCDYCCRSEENCFEEIQLCPSVIKRGIMDAEEVEVDEDCIEWEYYEYFEEDFNHCFNI
jgi:hypothetical protein